MEIVYDKKTEVTKNQFKALKRDADGICAFRTEREKFFIKLLIPKYKNYVQSIIKNS